MLPPPNSTLFPYTTLFRSLPLHQRRRPRQRRRHAQPDGGQRQRSEEHTSELQSLRHFVCRLLLEKKKCPSSDSPGYVAVILNVIFSGGFSVVFVLVCFSTF